MTILDPERPAFYLHADSDWKELASCKGIDPAVFHPTRGEIEVQRRALAICNGIPAKHRKAGTPPCPVRDQCLAFALSLPPSVDLAGIYGGKTHRERLIVRRKKLGNTRPRPECGTTSGFNYHRHNGEVPCQPCRDAEKRRVTSKEQTNEA